MPKKIANHEAGTVTFKFEDASEQVFDLSRVPDATRQWLAVHGASQKIGDTYAGAAKAENPLAFAKESVAEMIAALYAGETGIAREGGGSGRMTIFAEALVRVTGQTAEAVLAFVASMDDAKRKEWESKKKVALAMATITAERAAAKAKALAEKVDEAEEDLSIA